MNPETERKLTKARRAIRSAESIARDGDTDFAASRAYYAMLYVAQALLVERGLRFSKHSAVHAAFGQHFAKTAVLDPRFHRWLLDACDDRIEGDYGLDFLPTTEDVAETIQQAKEFLRTAREYLGLPPDDPPLP